MSRLCTICARGRSKGVKNKNLRLLHGKPLLAHSIAQARKTGLFDAIAVSSDSEAILDAAIRYEADFVVRRPDELASDAAPKLPAIQHCVRMVEDRTGKSFDTFVDLDATSPLRVAEDIVGAVRLLEERSVSNVLTGMPARRSPYFNLVELDNDGHVRLSKRPASPVVRRQDAPPCFDLNASIYVWRRDALLHYDYLIHSDTLLFVMPEERSIDIDSELDWAFVEVIMERRCP